MRGQRATYLTQPIRSWELNGAAGKDCIDGLKQIGCTSGRQSSDPCGDWAVGSSAGLASSPPGSSSTRPSRDAPVGPHVLPLM